MGAFMQSLSEGHGRMPSIWQAEKQAVVEASRDIARKGLVAGSAGNVSMRLGSDRELLAITASGKDYQAITAEDIQVINFEGDPVEGDRMPSVETMMHVAAYRARPDVQAVIHTHSIYASALAVCRLELPPIMDEMVVLLGGTILVTEYAPPGSDELAERAGAALKEKNAALIANHGVVGVGANLRQALAVCEMVERGAQIYVIARTLGKANPLPADVVSTETQLFRMMHLKGKQ